MVALDVFCRHLSKGWQAFWYELRLAFISAWDVMKGRKTIMYAGWVYANPEDQHIWRQLGMMGEMVYSESDVSSAYAPPEKRGVFEHCHATPKTMQMLLNDHRVYVPNTFTAYWLETDENLPRSRQLWGGAPVQI